MGRGCRADCLALMSSALVALAYPAIALAGPIDDLAAAAKVEGELNVIALPRDWCGYGGIIDDFKIKYGLRVNELKPQTSSEEEMDAIRAARDSAATPAPDVIDVGLSFGPAAKREGLLQPYKVRAWDSIPSAAKDAEAYWYGDYYGTLVFQVNANFVSKMPRDWADLLAPEYRNSVALGGNPSSNQAVLTVFAAGLSTSGGNAETATERGLDFFAELHRKGNFVPVVGRFDAFVDGRTPIMVRWDYLALGDRDSLAGKIRVEVIRPQTAVVAGIYVQAISAFAPHPNAARLWMEYLYSDETQLALLKGNCQPIRLAGLLHDDKVPADLRKSMRPSGKGRGNPEPFFPTLEQQEKARDTIMNGWEGIVGVDIECLPEEPAPLGPMSFNIPKSAPMCLPQ